MRRVKKPARKSGKPGRSGNKAITHSQLKTSPDVKYRTIPASFSDIVHDSTLGIVLVSPCAQA